MIRLMEPYFEIECNRGLLKGFITQIGAGPLQIAMIDVYLVPAVKIGSETYAVRVDVRPEFEATLCQN